MPKSDVMASTFKEKKQPKVISHIEIHPAMDGGHDVHTVHTHSYDHPDKVKHHAGPHESVALPNGHVLHSIAKEMGIETTGAGAGAEEPQSDKEAGAMA